MSALENRSSNGIKVSKIRQEELVESLKEQEQWVAFTQDKMPIDPTTGSGAKSNDSETWSDYETARAYAESNDLLVGFALTGENLVFVDLDGCRDPETGDIEDWALDIINRLDSYSEVSTSGTGLHVLTRGDVDIHSHKQTMANQTVDVDKTSEIEVYDDARFVLFTFDHVDGTPADITHCDDLGEVYLDYFGEAPDPVETPDFSDVELSLSEEKILKKALDSDEKFLRLWNGDTSAYSMDHSRADMALASKLAFWTACDPEMMDSLFRKSDLMRSKWDEQRGDETYGEMTIRKAVESTQDVYEGPAGGIPEDIDLVQQGGQYGRFRATEDGPEFDPVTNFTLERKEVLTEEGEQFVRLEVRPANAENFETTVSPEVFNEPRSFKNSICTRLSTSFSGSSQDLPELRKIVLRQNSPERVSTRTIGLHDDEFVAPGETFSKGDDYTHTYRETGSSVAEKWEIEDLDYDEEQVREILELLPDIREKERWLPVVGYCYAALFAPVVRDIEGELPSVSITGETGAGKSSSLRVLSRAFGLDGTAFAVDSTKFSLIKHLSAVNNVPVWYDEYKPHDIADYQLDRFQSLLRAATNGRTETRGNADKTEETYPLVAPIVLTGEQRIQGSAEQRRAIMTQFQRSATDRGSTTFEAFDQLQQYDLSNHAKFAIEKLLELVSEEDIEEIWEESKEHARTLAEDDVGGLAINALAMVKFGMTVCLWMCDRAGVTPSVDLDDVDEAIRYVAAQKGVENRTTHVDELLEQVVRCMDAGKITAWGSGYGNPSYKFTNIGEEDEELRLKFNRVFPEVSKYLKDYNIDIDLLAKDDYMDRFSDMANDESSYIIDNSKQTRGLNRCVAIDSNRLEEKLDVDLEDVRLDLQSPT